MLRGLVGWWACRRSLEVGLVYVKLLRSSGHHSIVLAYNESVHVLRF